MRPYSFRKLLLSTLVAISMVAGFGHAAASAAPVSEAMHHHGAKMDMQMPAPSQHAHRHVAGCAFCSMACCAMILPSLASFGAAREHGSSGYVPRLAFGQGVMTNLEPDPPRPLLL